MCRAATIRHHLQFNQPISKFFLESFLQQEVSGHELVEKVLEEYEEFRGAWRRHARAKPGGRTVSFPRRRSQVTTTTAAVPHPARANDMPRCSAERILSSSRSKNLARAKPP